ADETRSKLLHHSLRRTQHMPAPLDILRLVRNMLLILVKRNRIRYLNRHLPDLNLDSELLERQHRLAVERRDTLRFQGHERIRPIAAFDHEKVIDEVKLHFEESVFV